MDWFKLVKHYYDLGLWSDKMVQDAVIKGKITQAQADEITKKDYLTEE